MSRLRAVGDTLVASNLVKQTLQTLTFTSSSAEHSVGVVVDQPWR